jgi:hypothetical protein
VSQSAKECPAAASKEEVRIILHSPPSINFPPISRQLITPHQVNCVSHMRELNPSATEKLSGADLLRFSRARKCNAAAAVQVSRFSFPRNHNTRTPFNPLFRSCCWKASSGPTKLTCLISAAPGPRLPRRLICVLLGSTWSTGRSYTAACSWSYSRC